MLDPNYPLKGWLMEIALIKSYAEKPWRSPETYQLIEDSLRERWHVNVIHTENTETLHEFLDELKQKSGKNIFVFNIAEYLDEENKKGFLPALLDEWSLPHLGSSAETVAIGLDKVKTKKLLKENQIPTPRYFVAKERGPEIIGLAESIGYPLFVKPIKEGGHIGIDKDSIVYDYASLNKDISRILDEYDQPALVEKYIIGKRMREFSVGILEGEPRLFTPVEINFADMNVGARILSYEAAQKDLELVKLIQDKKILEEIINLAERTFTVVGARDYSRVDIRTNRTGSYVLEINIMPGLGPHSFLPEAAEVIHSLEYSQFIQKLTANSIKRNDGGLVA
jgi:D-alanine-D-alanine ligase